MNKVLLFTLMLLLTCGNHTWAQTDAPKIPYGNNPAAGGYKAINGINMYYEIYGQGKTLVILHGNGGSIRAHASRINYFKQFFKVIAIDSRAHGKSIDTISKTLTYDQMAFDVKVLLDSLHEDSVFIFGQSDGGILGLIIASKWPAKVAKLATFGANLFPGDKAVYKEIDDMVNDTLKTTKNPRIRKLYSLLAYEPHIPTAGLHNITADVLIMAGDRDVIRPEHSLLIFDNIPHANLFIMPGATHFGAGQKPDLFNLVMMDFLTKPFFTRSSVDIFTGKK